MVTVVVAPARNGKAPHTPHPIAPKKNNFLYRCVADLLSKENNKSLVTLTTQSGDLKSEILGEKLVSTEIGKGRTEWNEIPLSEELDTNNLNIKITDHLFFKEKAIYL